MIRAFDQAFALLKADTGMWDEIYAPLYQVLGGRGQNTYKYANMGSPLDFMQTKDIPPFRHFGGKEPNQDAYIEELMESILEHGMLGRNSDWWKWENDEGPEKGHARFDASQAGLDQVGNVAIPSLGYEPTGWNVAEGNHRLAALRRLGAPYVPAYTSSSGWREKKPYSADLPIGPNMRRWMGLDSEKGYDNAYSGYGIGASVGRRGMPIPPSFFFEQELVPGMGRLVPDLPNAPQPLLPQLPRHLTAADMPLEEVRGEPFGEWQNYPKWKVIHDE